MRTSDDLLAELKGLHPRLIDLSLGRIEGLLAKLGHPERRLVAFGRVQQAHETHADELGPFDMRRQTPADQSRERADQVDVRHDELVATREVGGGRQAHGEDVEEEVEPAGGGTIWSGVPDLTPGAGGRAADRRAASRLMSRPAGLALGPAVIGAWARLPSFRGFAS